VKRKIIIALLLFTVSITAAYAATLPKNMREKLENIRSASTVYDRNGRLIGNLYSYSRIWAPISKISPYLQKATVSIEDARFYQHNGIDDVRASYFLEETATEFDIQGLELDWTIVCWDANLRFNNNHFEFYEFNGTRWQNINKEDNILYLKNAYRVLLTRARQGFILFVPTGDENDITMQSAFYDGVYQYLKDIGLNEVYE
jgi:hypothetical protein